MANQSNLILDVEGAGLAATVVFNGIILSQDSMLERLSRAARLNGWAVAGMNTLQVHLASLPPPVGNPLPSRPQPRFVLKLRSVLPDTPGSSDQVLVDYKWDPASQPLPLSGSSEVLSQNLQLSAPAAWSWTRAAQVVQLSEEDSRAIAGLLSQLHAALTARAIAEVVRLQYTQVGEQAVAAGDDPQKMLGRYGEFLQERMAEPDWTVRPLVWESLKITPMAGGRVHRITDARGLPPIVSTAGGGVFAIEPQVSKVDGRWVIVR
jgi:hypothetical protein